MKSFVTLIAAEDPTQTHHWLLPETAEIIYGGLATVIVVTLLVKFAGPMVKKAMADRTAKIQSEIDNARESKTVADAEASKIRAALGDISAERSRILSDAEKQAEALLIEGRARLDAEVRDMEAKAEADIAAAAARSGDELRQKSPVCQRRLQSVPSHLLSTTVPSKISSNHSFHPWEQPDERRTH